MDVDLFNFGDVEVVLVCHLAVEIEYGDPMLVEIEGVLDGTDVFDGNVFD